MSNFLETATASVGNSLVSDAVASAATTHPNRRRLSGNLTGVIWNSAYATTADFTTAELVALEQIIYRDFALDYV